MATVNTMAVEMIASDRELEMEEEDEELLIEALRRHLTYVESRLAEIAHQMQDTSPPVGTEVTDAPRGSKKKESLHVRPTAVEEPAPVRPKLPRASELTRLPRKPKPVLSDKEKEKLQREAAARKKQDMQHLSVLKALELLKRDYRDRYTELMQLQVKDQQRRVREKDAEWEKKLAQREERNKKQRLRRKPRVFRSSAVADYSFLDNVHQGIFYKVVSLEMELRKKGVLKSLQDLQTFWDHMLSGDTDSSAVATPVDRNQQAYSRAHIHQHRVVAESRVLEEEEEEEEEGSSHSWAITAVPGTDRGASAGKQAGSLQTKRKITQSGQPFQFQPAEPPQFNSLHQLLRSSSWEEKQETQRHTAKVRAVQKKTRMVEHMFDVARANEQVTARLLEHLDIDFTFDVLPLPLEYSPPPSSAHPPTLAMAAIPSISADGKETEKEVKQSKEEEVEEHRKEKVEQRTDEVPADQLTTLGAVTQTAVGEECVSDGGSRDRAGGSTPVVSVPVEMSSSSELTSPTSEGTEQPTSSSPPPPPCIPLTMESLMVVGDVKAAKSTSMWSNYLLAGR